MRPAPEAGREAPAAHAALEAAGRLRSCRARRRRCGSAVPSSSIDPGLVVRGIEPQAQHLERRSLDRRPARAAWPVDHEVARIQVHQPRLQVAQPLRVRDRQVADAPGAVGADRAVLRGSWQRRHGPDYIGAGRGAGVGAEAL